MNGAVVYGAFLGWGKQDFDFGGNRGDFDQQDTTLGGFLAWYSGDVWVNANASWTNLSYDVTRDVHLGPALRSYSGSPAGDNWTFGANAGWDFHAGKLTHGPVIGVCGRASAWTAIPRTASTPGPVVPRPGLRLHHRHRRLQASYAISDTVVPYGRLRWEHEFEDAPEQAFARLNSMPGCRTTACRGWTSTTTTAPWPSGAYAGLRLDADIGATASVGQEGGNLATVFVTVGASSDATFGAARPARWNEKRRCCKAPAFAFMWSG